MKITGDPTQSLSAVEKTVIMFLIAVVSSALLLLLVFIWTMILWLVSGW